MTEMPLVLSRLADALNISVKPQPLAETMPIWAFRVDLSRLRLKLGDKTPCIWLDADVLRQHAPAQLRSFLVESIIAQGWQRRNTLIVADGDVTDLKVLCRGEGLGLIVLDQAAQARITSAPAISRALVEEMSREVPISLLAPYETSRPVTGEQFFGREAELRHLLQNASGSVLITGNRRMGKTSLAREALRRAARRSPALDAHVYIDCSVIRSRLDLYAEIMRGLGMSREVERVYRDNTFSMQHFLQRTARAKGERLMLVLDEVDGLLEWDARDGWQVLAMFRGLTSPVTAPFEASAPSPPSPGQPARPAATTQRGEEGQPLRLILAGFRLAAQRALDHESPLFNFVQTLQVSNFSQADVEQLVIEPMLNLGISFSDRSALIARIQHETGGQPNLVQHYCQFIVHRLEHSGSREATPAALDAALGDAALRRRIAGEMFQNTTNLEQFIVLGYIQHAWLPDQAGNFKVSDADAWLHQHGAHLFRSDLERALDALEATGVLVRHGKTYCFAFAALPHMIVENYEVGYQIEKILEEGLT